MNALNDISGLELDEIKDLITVAGAKPFHAKQIYRWLYRHNVTDIREMTDLSIGLRDKLSNE